MATILASKGTNHSSNTKMKTFVALSLRAASMSATVAAALLMGLNKETKTAAVAVVGTTPLYQTFTAKFTHTPAFVYFVIANAVASVYNLWVLSLGRLLFSKCKCKGYHAVLLLHISDMVMMALVATGAAAAASIAEVGEKGNVHARWSPICDKFGDYCHRGGLAIVASIVGAALLILLNLHSIVTLHKNAAT